MSKNERISNNSELKGNQLISLLAKATGLPTDYAEERLASVIRNSGKSEEDVTIDDIRSLLAEFVQDTLLSAKTENEHIAC